MRYISIALLLLLMPSVACAEFGYVVEKSTGNIISYWDLESKPQSTNEYDFIECLESEKPELYKPTSGRQYNAKRFLASCASDETMQTITAKLSDRQYFDFAMCLQNANFEMLSTIMGQLATAGVITEEDVSYFVGKLLTEEGVQL